MQTTKPDQLHKNDCVVFTHKGEHMVRRIVSIEHDETFATPGGGGDLFVITFEEREGVPLRVECPPHVQFDRLTPEDLAAVMAAGLDLVRMFVEAAVPPIERGLDELAKLSEDQLREIIERGEATRT